MATDKNKAWQACARYCRVRDCLRDTGYAFLGRCYTCALHFHISALEAGHAISGRRNAVLFDVGIIRNQCRYCNLILHGRQKEFRAKLANEHGQQWLADRLRRGKRIIPDKRIDYGKMREGFEKKYRKLMASRGFKTWGQLLKEGR